MKGAIIEVTDLTTGWGELVLQRDMSFEVERGEIFAILGGSGCGKSTLLRNLIGLEPPIRGTIRVDGVDAPELQVGRPRFGVVFQSCALFSSLTVGENIGLALRQWTDLPREAIQAIVRAKLRLVGLDGAAGKLPAELSGGMKKRAAIARALALEPELLFLDEPSAGLDPISAVELDELILTLNRLLGTTVVLVSHELPSIFAIARRCIILDPRRQRVVAVGDPRMLRDGSSDSEVHELLNRKPRSA